MSGLWIEIVGGENMDHIWEWIIFSIIIAIVQVTFTGWLSLKMAEFLWKKIQRL